MLNQVILVGRVEEIDELAGVVTIDIKRPNENDSDLIPVKLTDGLIESVMKYLTKDSIIGVKANLNINNNILRIIGEKLTFINTKNE